MSDSDDRPTEGFWSRVSEQMVTWRQQLGGVVMRMSLRKDSSATAFDEKHYLVVP